MAVNVLQSFPELLLLHNIEQARDVYSKCLEKLKRVECASLDDIRSTNSVDGVGTALISGDGEDALKTTGDGSCLFNPASILFCGDESLSGDIRLFVAGEFDFNATYYASHEMLRSQCHVTISEEALKMKLSFAETKRRR